MQIPLTLLEQGILVLLGAYIVWTGRPAWALGIHMSIALWTRVFFVGPLPNIWFFMAVIVGAVLVDLHRRKHLTPLPRHYQGIVVWMGLWWMWIALLLVLYDPDGSRGLFRSLILYIMVPMIVIMVGINTLERIKGFAIAFIITTLIGGWKALTMLNLTFDYLLTDPTLSNTYIIRLGLVNYHWFAYSFALSLILTVALFMQARRGSPAMILLPINAVICAYFLFLAGSRQALNASAIVALGLIIWGLFFNRNVPKLRLALLTYLVISIGIAIYLRAPHLILRDEDNLTQTLDVVGDRGELWAIGWRHFLNSPIWGNGFVYAVYSHNLLIGTLSDQGIVGMVFQLGFFVFVFWQSRGILAGIGTVEQAIWRIAFLGIIGFGLIHGMASGSVLSTWHMYWAAAFLWWLNAMVAQTTPSPAPGAQTVRPPVAAGRVAPPSRP